MGGGGKGGGKVQIVKYYMTVHYALCHGVVDRLRRIVIKEKDAWTGGQVGRRRIHLRDGELFGGQTKEGGIEGVVDWQDGAFGQQVHARVAERWGKTPSTMPGYGGIATACFSRRGRRQLRRLLLDGQHAVHPRRRVRGLAVLARLAGRAAGGSRRRERVDSDRVGRHPHWRQPLERSAGMGFRSNKRGAGFERLVPRHALYRPPHRPLGKRNAEYDPAHELEPLGRRPSDRRGRPVLGRSRPL